MPRVGHPQTGSRLSSLLRLGLLPKKEYLTTELSSTEEEDGLRLGDKQKTRGLQNGLVIYLILKRKHNIPLAKIFSLRGKASLQCILFDFREVQKRKQLPVMAA